MPSSAKMVFPAKSILNWWMTEFSQTLDTHIPYYPLLPVLSDITYSVPYHPIYHPLYYPILYYPTYHPI